MSISFRKLTCEDAESMRLLEHECFKLPWGLNQCERALKQKNFQAWGYWQNFRLLAYISFYHFSLELEILNFAVTPARRRQGLGQKLLSLLLQASDKMDIEKIALEVRETNLPAIRLYEKSGFLLEGVRKNYYPDTGERALIYVWRPMETSDSII